MELTDADLDVVIAGAGKAGVPRFALFRMTTTRPYEGPIRVAQP